ncbi:MAG: hypothetical protein ABI273_18195 [Lacunisphaera sp.]
MKFRLALLLSVAVLVFANSVRANSADEVIAKARAYLGPEGALNSVRSIHFTGALEIMVPEAKDEASGAATGTSLKRLPMEILFQKPYEQMMIVNRDATTDTMVLDDYDGWSRIADRKDPKKWRLTLLDTEQIKQLRANTWENLNFFAGLEHEGGTVQLGADTTIDGIVCAKVSFIHSDHIVFHRYFDKGTGRLVKTETANGGEIREEGELKVEGIRFPRKIVNKGPNGQVTTIIFDQIVLNESFPPSRFAVPSFPSD